MTETFGITNKMGVDSNFILRGRCKYLSNMANKKLMFWVKSQKDLFWKIVKFNK